MQPVEWAAARQADSYGSLARLDRFNRIQIGKRIHGTPP
jgi:hypothetical protein